MIIAIQRVVERVSSDYKGEPRTASRFFPNHTPVSEIIEWARENRRTHLGTGDLLVTECEVGDNEPAPEQRGTIFISRCGACGHRLRPDLMADVCPQCGARENQWEDGDPDDCECDRCVRARKEPAPEQREES